MSKVKPQIVVASYKENLKWIDKLKDLGYDVVVYNTSSNGPFSFTIDSNSEISDLTIVDHIRLPNTDREAGQWLYHMVHNRNNLADFTVFLQADLGWSAGNFCRETMGVRESAVDELIDWLENKSCNSTAHFLSYLHTEPDYLHSGPQDEAVFNEFVAPLGGSVCPPAIVRGTNGGQFRASRDKILSLPEEYLQGLLELSSTTPLAHKFEYYCSIIMDATRAAFPNNKKVKPETLNKNNENAIPETTKLC